jgi:hypothetical protein
MACFYPGENQRSIAQEGRETLNAQIHLAPYQYGADVGLSQAYQSLQQQLAQSGLYGTQGGTIPIQWMDKHGVHTEELPVSAAPGLLSLAQGASQELQGMLQGLQTGATSYNLGQLSQISPEITKLYTQAIQSANPEQAAFLQALNQQALGELNLGSQLDPSLQREVSQAVRGGQAARGLGYGNSDLYEEAMTRGQAGQVLKQQRQNFANTVAGLNQYARVDPMAAIMSAYQPIDANKTLAAALGLSVPQSNTSYTNPWTSYSNELFGANQSAQMDADIAKSNWWNMVSRQAYEETVHGLHNLLGAVGGAGGGGSGGGGGGGGNMQGLMSVLSMIGG